MSSPGRISFLTYYIHSLAERTRLEKASTKFGFDWIIYNLALASDLTPYRLPFFRGTADQISRTKTEPEMGIDCSFISPDRKTLTIFVLKDEELRNSTWTQNDFDTDLRKAAAPDLTPPEFRDVREVRIVLAYNKDEDQTGIQLFNNLAKALGTRVCDDVTLAFERWNLTTIAEMVEDKLLTPSLLPQKFFSLFNYICSQFSDFRHGTDEWVKQLVPNWRRFLDDVLRDNPDERSIRLLPVALLILAEHGKSNPSAETGWIDLLEWAMLAAWNVHRSTEHRAVKQAIFQMWVGFYLVELEKFYTTHAAALSAEHSLEIRGSMNYLDAVAASVISHWHIARLGILALGYGEILSRETAQLRIERANALQRVANWLVGLLNANPSSKRPFLDIHHIELFLIWRTLWQVGRKQDIYHWLQELRNRLFVRRIMFVPLPFLEGRNSLDLVLEYVATNKRPPEYCDTSSLYLLIMLELCFSLESAQRNELLALIHNQLVLGLDSEGKQVEGFKPIDLIGWLPPSDWGERVLSQSLADDGESQTIEPLPPTAEADGSSIAGKINDFVVQSRAAQAIEFPDGLPPSVIILACLKHGSPLPPEFWRLPIFGKLAPNANAVGEDKISIQPEAQT
jgi:hypothetical protein